MELYLIRHGKPEPIKSNLSGDERALSENGKLEMIGAVSKWKKFIPPFDYIISSPLKRAKETALIIKDILGIKNDFIFESGLSSGMSIDELLVLVNSVDANSVAIVGHEPHISRYASYLISDGSASIFFRQGMIVNIDFTGKVLRGAGELYYQLPTEIFKH